MASLFGSVATEVGGAIKENVNTRIEDRRIDDDAQREMQLQKQRMLFDSSELDKRIGADDKRQVRQNDFETTMFDRETEAATDAADLNRTHEMDIETYRGETDLAQEYIKAYYARSTQRAMSGNGWKVEFDREQVVDPTSPSGFSMQEYVNAQGPGGRPYKIQGDYAYPAGEENPQAYPFKDEGERHAAEGGLYDGTMTIDEFKGAFGYIPANYIFGQVSREDTGLQNSMERDGIRMPVWMLGKDDRRSGSLSEGARSTGGSSSQPVNSASAALREIAEREGRDPTPEETDQVVREFRERQGLGEYPDGVEPGDMGSPYQGDFEGGDGPTEFGQRVLDASSGAISEGAAVAEEAPTEPATETEAPAPEPEMVASTGPSLEQATGGELTDAVASSIADSIASAMMGGLNEERDIYMTGLERQYFNTLDEAGKAEFVEKLRNQKSWSIDSPVPKNWKPDE